MGGGHGGDLIHWLHVWGSSGTEMPVFALSALIPGLAKLLGSHATNDLPGFRHLFSCEFATDKQTWIRSLFPQLQILFTDITLLGQRASYNVWTNYSDVNDKVISGRRGL